MEHVGSPVEQGPWSRDGRGVEQWWPVGQTRTVEKRRKGDERRKKMLTSGPHLSLRGEHKYNGMYVFVHTCSWARVVFIRISWHI
jgi:hypothetical protein